MNDPRDAERRTQIQAGVEELEKKAEAQKYRSLAPKPKQEPASVPPEDRTSLDKIRGGLDAVQQEGERLMAFSTAK